MLIFLCNKQENRIIQCTGGGIQKNLLSFLYTAGGGGKRQEKKVIFIPVILKSF